MTSRKYTFRDSSVKSEQVEGIHHVYTDEINNPVYSISGSEADLRTTYPAERDHETGLTKSTADLVEENNQAKLLDIGDVETDAEFRRYRITKQMALVGCWISIGLFSSILGPTLPDIRIRLGVDYDEVAWVVVGRDIGMIFGSLLGGFINERFYHQMDLILAIALFVASASSALAPNFTVIGLTAAMFVINGFSEGLINTGGITMVMHMWGKKRSGAAQQFLHFGFGVGSLIAPQIAKPFLGPDREDDELTTTVSSVSSAPLVDESQIEYAYAIIASLVAFFGLVMLGFFIAKKPPLLKEIYRPVQSLSKDMISPASCAKGYLCTGIAFLVLLFIYYFQISGGSRLVATFLFSFATEGDLKMTKSSAANLQSAYWIGFTGGRGLGAVIAAFIPVVAMTAGDVFGVLATMTCIFIFGNTYETALWVLVPILGVFMGPLFPQGLTWSNYYLDMNPLGVMVLLIGGNLGGFAYQFTMTSLFDADPFNLLRGFLVFACAVTGMYIILQILGCCLGKKLKQEEDKK